MRKTTKRKRMGTGKAKRTKKIPPSPRGSTGGLPGNSNKPSADLSSFTTGGTRSFTPGKLSDSDILYVRYTYQRYSRSRGSGALARQLGVSSSAIKKVVYGLTGKDAGLRVPGYDIPG